MIPTSIGVLYFSMDEVPIIKLALVNSCAIPPDSCPFRLIIFNVTLVRIPVFVMKLTLRRSSIFEYAFEVGVFAIFHLSFTVRFAIFVALPFVQSFVGTRDSIRLVAH